MRFSSVPQRTGLGPFLYLLFTADIPTKNFITIADDTAIMSINGNPKVASENFQIHLNQIDEK